MTDFDKKLEALGFTRKQFMQMSGWDASLVSRIANGQEPKNSQAFALEFFLRYWKLRRACDALLEGKPTLAQIENFKRVFQEIEASEETV